VRCGGKRCGMHARIARGAFVGSSDQLQQTIHTRLCSPLRAAIDQSNFSIAPNVAPAEVEAALPPLVRASDRDSA
jgi:hypothetical protein